MDIDQQASLEEIAKRQLIRDRQITEFYEKRPDYFTVEMEIEYCYKQIRLQEAVSIHRAQIDPVPGIFRGIRSLFRWIGNVFLADSAVRTNLKNTSISILNLMKQKVEHFGEPR